MKLAGGSGDKPAEPQFALEVAEHSPAALHPKDPALTGKLLAIRAKHGDRTVAKALLGIGFCSARETGAKTRRARLAALRVELGRFDTASRA
jgi:hypothetical protein